MKKTRIVEIEMARIISCFIVICLHTSSWYFSESGVTHSALLIKCFLQDAVPIFWYIMGFFLFSKTEETFTRLAKRTFLGVFLPVFLMMIVSQILGPWFYCESSLKDCLRDIHIDFANLFGNLIQWKSSMTLGGHFWYIFYYIKVILWYPLISLVCKTSESATRCRYYLYGLAIIAIIITDFNQICSLTWNGYTYELVPYTVIDTTMLHVLLGYEISIYYGKIKEYSKYIFPVAVVMFFVFNIQRYYLQLGLFRGNTSNDYFLHIDSLVSFLSSLGLFIAILTMPLKPSARLKNVINFISSATFGIYVVHRCIYEKLNNLGIRDQVYSIARKNGSLIPRLFCTITYGLLIFSVSFIVVLFLKGIKKLWKMFIYIFKPVD